MTAPDQPTFLSAANAPYWRCLWQLLRAARRKGWHRMGDWIVYDMGLQSDRRALLERHFPWAEFRTLDFSALPAHYPPARGTYAWKPEIINRVAGERAAPLIWLDSATLPRGTPAPMLGHLREHGIYLLRGQAPLRRRCAPAVLDRLGVPSAARDMPERVATIGGFDARRADIRTLLQDWATLAADPDMISPADPGIPRHMHDQALLGALTLTRAAEGTLTLPEADIDISSGRPVTFLSTRNKVGPGAPLWIDPFARAWYWGDKTIDQWLHRRRAG
ncbi:hypothetical protein SAMN04490248_1062 [Salinihabitans flavidus]|uniref:Capsular polysaccharide synthesis protein n=1 Tax=Salinihabitans flavidus TaxID=569882 RepID=A0A1H8Q5G1_9RHOB|nr:hypothetical protein [Salinihabitans flavidus]SEO48993.1 hypothetical protein SAMN04490248_1062 [Salinihabitans flavidus]